jgi:hypothetical protein
MPPRRGREVGKEEEGGVAAGGQVDSAPLGWVSRRLNES